MNTNQTLFVKSIQEFRDLAKDEPAIIDAIEVLDESWIFSPYLRGERCIVKVINGFMFTNYAAKSLMRRTSSVDVVVEAVLVNDEMICLDILKYGKIELQNKSFSERMLYMTDTLVRDLDMSRQVYYQYNEELIKIIKENYITDYVVQSDLDKYNARRMRFTVLQLLTRLHENAEVTEIEVKKEYEANDVIINKEGVAILIHSEMKKHPVIEKVQVIRIPMIVEELDAMVIPDKHYLKMTQLRKKEYKVNVTAKVNDILDSNNLYCPMLLYTKIVNPRIKLLIPPHLVYRSHFLKADRMDRNSGKEIKYLMMDALNLYYDVMKARKKERDKTDNSEDIEMEKRKEKENKEKK